MTYNLVEIQKRQESMTNLFRKLVKLYGITLLSSLGWNFKEKKDLVWQRNECE